MGLWRHARRAARAKASGASPTSSRRTSRSVARSGPRWRSTSAANRSSTSGVASPTCGPVEPGRRTTPAVVFSCTKGVLAICAYLLVEDGRSTSTGPVADYWPAFGAGGQGRHPGPLAALPPGRPLVAGPGADARRGPGLGPGHRCDRAPGAALATRDRVRLPHDDLRLARRRGHPPGERRVRGRRSCDAASPSRSASASGWACQPRSASTSPGSWRRCRTPTSSWPVRSATRMPSPNASAPRRWAARSPSRRRATTSPSTTPTSRPPRSRARTASATHARWRASTRPASSAVDGVRVMTPASVDDALVERSSGAPVFGGADRRRPLGHRLHARLVARRHRSSGHAASGTGARAASWPSPTTTHDSRLRLRQQPDGRHPRRAGLAARRGRARLPRCLTRASSHARDTVRHGPQLLTYPDSLGGGPGRRSARSSTGRSPASSPGVHVLPPFPSSGDRGFAPLTYREIDPRFGSWADIRALAADHDVRHRPHGQPHLPPER